MEIKSIYDIKHKDKLIILGHGPSVNKILPNIDKYKENYNIMSLNDWYNLGSFHVDYIVCSTLESSLYTEMPKYLTKDIIVFTKSHDGVMKRLVKERPELSYFLYRFRTENGFDICKELQKISGGRRCGTGASTIVLNLIIAVVMGFKEIYYIGVELDSRFKYGGNKNKKKGWYGPVKKWEDLEKDMDFWSGSIHQDIQKIKNSANNMGISVIDMTHMTKQLIERIL